MTKTEFLSALEQRLAPLPAEERQKQLDFYAESLEDRMEEGMSEEEAVADLGDLQTICTAILAEQPLPALVKAQLQKNRRQSQNHTVFMLLTIIGFPFWFPLALAAASLILAFYIVIWSLIVSLYAISVGLAFCSVAGVLGAGMHMFVSGPPTGIMLLGMAIFCGGLFLLSVPLVKLCTVKLIQCTKWTLYKIKLCFISKKEAL